MALQERLQPVKVIINVKIDGNNGSVTANTVKAGDVVVGKANSDGKEGNFVTGLDNKTWDPENPVAVPGRAATEDQLKSC